MSEAKRAVILLSGGMDSATLLYHLRASGRSAGLALSFDYGQRHRCELAAAAALADEIGVEHRVVDLRSITALLPGSALTDAAVAVPHGHYAAPSMALTVVPGRNAVMIAAAWAAAAAHGFGFVAAAVHAGDHFIYPDCRPRFIALLGEALAAGTEGAGPNEGAVQLLTPFLHMNKTDIARLGAGLGVPYAMTWTCYEGGDLHCGRCGACVERREAFRDAGLSDPTRYAVVAA